MSGTPLGYRLETLFQLIVLKFLCLSKPVNYFLLNGLKKRRVHVCVHIRETQTAGISETFYVEMSQNLKWPSSLPLVCLS